MTDFKPTEEQQAIIEQALSTKDSLLIESFAGCGKTSTLELLCAALPVQPILSIAFNKRIAEEMQKRLPGHVKAQTINSLGHGVWAKYVNKRLILDKDKTHTILKGLLDKMNRKERSAIYEQMSEVLKAVNLAKQQGYIPDELYPNANHLVSRQEFFDALDEPDIDQELVDWLLNESIKQAYQGTIDFNDQIYMPTLFGGQFPQFGLVMADEVQDFSALNHALMDKIVPARLMGVGDSFQSIYAFRGADTNSMKRLKARFSMTSMPLSVSFRCPIKIVQNVHWRVPSFKWAPWAIEGEIFNFSGGEESQKNWSASAIPDGSSIVCRNNAPLLKCALELLKLGKGVKLVGTDLGPGLIRTLKKLGDESMSRLNTFEAINRWEAETAAKRKNKEGVADKADCLRVFAEFGETLGAAIAYAEHLFSTAGPIQLMSGHKSKGLEFDTVYHLDPGLVPSKWAKGEGLEQEHNLKYVIETRAKKTLYKVDLAALRP